MEYKLTVQQKRGYLHAVVTGQNSRETATRYLNEVRRECAARGGSRLLIEERLEGPRLGMLDVFQVAAQQSEEALGSFKAIAYVDVNAQGDLMKFAETVALNRALPVTVFATVAEAEQWLAGQVGDDDGTGAG